MKYNYLKLNVHVSHSQIMQVMQLYVHWNGNPIKIAMGFLGENLHMEVKFQIT